MSLIGIVVDLVEAEAPLTEEIMEAPSLPDESKEVEVTQSSIKNEIELCDVEGNPQSSSKVDAPPVCHGYSRSSLASTSSRTVCILISCGIVVAHALLLWGQIDPQWSVYVCECSFV